MPPKEFLGTVKVECFKCCFLKQANHSSTDTERSGSDTPVSQSQDSSSTTSGQQPAAEVVPGVAAMQQGGNFNMAAFPGKILLFTEFSSMHYF